MPVLVWGWVNHLRVPISLDQELVLPANEFHQSHFRWITDPQFAQFEQGHSTSQWKLPPILDHRYRQYHSLLPRQDCVFYLSH